uniref:Cyclin H n=1 Tax=Apteryx owenii TaxID=8824 RepID=A0A8B9Q9X0_APTOW
MYHSSTQRRHWTFRSDEELARCRVDANRKFRSKAVAGGKVQQTDPFLLEPLEELTICKYYEKRLLDFCAVFKPSMPRSVVTRYPMLENPEVLRKTADDFLNRVALTDAYLLFTPSQIALTAILSSASRAGINMESYLSESLMLKENRTSLAKLLDGMKCMKNLIKKYELPRPEEVAALKQKLEKCHSSELSLIINPKKRKGYEDDEYITKKSKMDEEEWTDDDLVDSL